MSDERETKQAKKPEEEKKEKKEKKRKLLFPANKKGKHVMPLMNLLRILFYPVHFLVYPYKLHGNKKAGPGAYIYFGNHYCIWDVFYPARTTWEGIHYLMKEELFHKPIVGAWARRVGAIGVKRDGTDVRTLLDATKVLKNGEKVSLFPEGTRNKVSDEEFLPFHGGAALLAIKTKTPVIPFVICNRPHIFRVTHVVFGEPMELSEYYDRKLSPEEYAEADEKLKNRLYEMRAQFRAGRKRK